MRVPIAVQIKPFDIEKVQPQIDDVTLALGRYLEGAPRKSDRSKHGLMGPVGKVLSEVKSGRRDGASLKGYAIRVHEASRRSPSRAGLEALEQGIDQLTGLLAKAPITAHDQILDRLDYGLYYQLRKQSLQQREELNTEFRRFIEDRYHTLEEVSRAWGEQISAWNRIYVFSSKSKTWSRANQAKRDDVNAFWEWLKTRTAAPVEVLLDDEED